ncbi:hypothetical protein D3C71_1417180 [compost metagenome]
MAAHAVEKIAARTAEHVTQHVGAKRGRLGRCRRRDGQGDVLAGCQRISAGVKDQGREGVLLELLDLANEDDVVTAFILECGRAFEARRAALQQGHAVLGRHAVHAGEFVLTAARELVGEAFLLGAENMHRPVPCSDEVLQAEGFLGETPQHQWRVQRNRVEAVGRETNGLAVATHGGDHGHAGRKRT